MSDLVPPMMPDDLDALIQTMERVQQLEAELAKMRLTDAEREAIKEIVEWNDGVSDAGLAALRGLLERLG